MPTPAFPSAARAAAVQPSRSRSAQAHELLQIPWLARLDADECARVQADLRVLTVQPGELVCRVGRPVTYWFGVIDGLLKMSSDSEMPITFTGVPSGGWFGEGTVLKGESYRLKEKRRAGLLGQRSDRGDRGDLRPVDEPGKEVALVSTSTSVIELDNKR